MRLENPSTLNPFEPEGYFQQVFQEKKVYIIKNLLFLIPDQENKQETQNLNSKNLERLETNIKINLGLSFQFFLDPDIIGLKSKKNF